MVSFRPVRARVAPPGLRAITAVPSHLGRERRGERHRRGVGKALPDVLPTAVAGSGYSCLLYPDAVLCLESPSYQRKSYRKWPSRPFATQSEISKATRLSRDYLICIIGSYQRRVQHVGQNRRETG